MPPLLSAKTCWIAGWVALLVGLVASFVSFNTLYRGVRGYGSDDSFGTFYALSQAGPLLTQLGLLLLVAAVIVRHVERLRDGPGHGREEPGVEPPPRDHLDLDEVSGAAIDPDPGHR